LAAAATAGGANATFAIPFGGVNDGCCAPVPAANAVELDLLGAVPAAALAITCGDCFDAGESGYFRAEGPAPASVDSDGFFDQENIFVLGIFQPLLLLQPTLKNELATMPKAANRVHLVTSNRILDHSLDHMLSTLKDRRLHLLAFKANPFVCLAISLVGNPTYLFTRTSLLDILGPSNKAKSAKFLKS